MADDCECEFEDILKNIYEYAKNFVTKTEQYLIQKWIQKLCTENYSDEALVNRNEYARYFEQMISQGRLNYPFVNPPTNDPLMPLEDVLENRNTSLFSPQEGGCPMRKPRQREDHGESQITSSTTSSFRVYGSKQPEQEYTQRAPDCVLDDVLKRIIGELGLHMSLPQFVGLVSPHTCDLGSILRKVMGEEQVAFRDFMERLISDRNTDVGELLAREQAALKDRYEMWQQRMVNREMQSEALLREIAPHFAWEQYSRDPSYIQKLFPTQKTKDRTQSPRAAEDFKEWRRQLLHRLSFLRNQTKAFQKENERLVHEINQLRREHHERQTLETLNEQMQHEKNTLLYNKLRNLRQRREKQQNKIDELFQQIEACQCRKRDPEN